MPKLLHLEGSDLAPAYSGGERCRDFKVGETREVTEELASYLLATFPGCFKRVGSKTKSAAVSAPEKDGAMKAPAKRKAPAKKRKATLKGKA